MAQDAGHGVRRGGHVRISQHGEHAVPRLLDKAHGSAYHHGESPFAADQRAPDVEPVLGQQVLKRVAGDLAAEAAGVGQVIGADLIRRAGNNLLSGKDVGLNKAA